MRSDPETWKPVRGYEGLYEISDKGRLRALFKAGNFHKPGRLLRPWLMKSGYLQVHLMRPGAKRKAACVHRLLLEAFIGPAPEKCECRHLNGDRADNNISNLAWGTHKQNVEDSRRHGTMIQGERAGSSKLTADDVVEIRRLIGEHVSRKDIAQLFQIDVSNISCIVLRKTWSHL